MKTRADAQSRFLLYCLLLKLTFARDECFLWARGVEKRRAGREKDEEGEGSGQGLGSPYLFPRVG